MRRITAVILVLLGVLLIILLAEWAGLIPANALPGSGDITVEGTTNRVAITLAGSGNVLCSDLKAHNADVTLLGSGTVTVFADQNLSANLAGSGTIHYDGNPPQVTKHVTGSGAITP